jgi:DNA-directed RNA polymerase subunit RPC12/RpoP
MEKSLSSLRYASGSSMLATPENSKCGTCGEEFKAPLLAMFSSGTLMEEYYACPKCLSKVDNYKPNQVEVEESEEEETPLNMKVEEKTEDTVVCMHHLGYLKQRSKNTPVPEACLTCSKMIDCMLS